MTGMTRAHRAATIAVAVGCVLAAAGSSTAARTTVYRIDHVADGDTVTLRNGQRVRLVQIDTPEVYFGVECYGRQASGTTKHLLPPGARVYLFPEPATDRVDSYGRLLRYVVPLSDGLNVNIRLVAVGAAAPTSTGVAGAVTPTGWRRWRGGRGRRSSASGERARTRCTTRTRASRLAVKRSESRAVYETPWSVASSFSAELGEFLRGQIELRQLRRDSESRNLLCESRNSLRRSGARSVMNWRRSKFFVCSRWVPTRLARVRRPK
jgi:endonuclease YncB( thermonuclease family)